jgi:hypothetical protein
MKRLPIVLMLAALALTGCASGPSGVTLPEVAGDTDEERFVNTVRGGLVEHYATFSSEQVLNIGTTFCQVMGMSVRDGDDPIDEMYEASEGSDLGRGEVDYLIAASKRYLCPDVY